MSLADAVNGAFELLGGASIWANVVRIRRDKKIRGIDWRITGFFTTWGFWNLWYYPSLGQWASFSGGVVIVAANVVWLYYAIKYKDQ
jgi:hypothetical protein